MEEQFEFLNKSPSTNSINCDGFEEEEEWILLNEVMNSPFYTGNFDGNDELEAVFPSEFSLNSPQKMKNEYENLNENISILLEEEQEEEEPYKPYQSLILTPEFLISLEVFSKNMNWLSKEVAVKCVQSSQITTKKIISLSKSIRNQCRAISSMTSSNSFMNYGVQI
ncbi:hypothetical protein DICPUDRAFT_152980 [Dictyostelium purpureum]|uniref:Uncharacterized protein n=1 Tax=Dictyostelium purpureum TaxID=5786 RepID=F0ZMR9_DICPU|nr:uncharacterized protein DICPUDRAFT_152980 [Dictyostelium purpureum]EGC34759.1 hypothetical protein DICPUDRAFT_152980 [Dictyostelium purpureum]|eukprot:XP_003288721.1 hypothetical protein DICPUDRAFT_152980 [Dictyostelium purpureum]